MADGTVGARRPRRGPRPRARPGIRAGLEDGPRDLDSPGARPRTDDGGRRASAGPRRTAGRTWRQGRRRGRWQRRCRGRGVAGRAVVPRRHRQAAADVRRDVRPLSGLLVLPAVAARPAPRRAGASRRRARCSTGLFCYALFRRVSADATERGVAARALGRRLRRGVDPAVACRRPDGALVVADAALPATAVPVAAALAAAAAFVGIGPARGLGGGARRGAGRRSEHPPHADQLARHRPRRDGPAAAVLAATPTPPAPAPAKPAPAETTQAARTSIDHAAPTIR